MDTKKNFKDRERIAQCEGRPKKKLKDWVI